MSLLTHPDLKGHVANTTKTRPSNKTNAALDTSSVVNLSNVTLTDNARRLRITEFFHEWTTDNQSDPFHPKSLWTPPTDRVDTLNAYLNAVKHDLFTTKPRRIRYNLPKAQRQALRLLKQSIKSADKGSATVIMDRRWYLNECYRQLNNPTFYEQQDTDLIPGILLTLYRNVLRITSNECSTINLSTKKQTIPIT